MPRLDCNVVTCRYNSEKGCTKDRITVGGPRASLPEETCCDSFEEKRGESFRNSSGKPRSQVDIQCAACNCVHNEACSCFAEYVAVGGAGASRCRDTVCGSFFKR